MILFILVVFLEFGEPYILPRTVLFTFFFFCIQRVMVLSSVVMHWLILERSQNRNIFCMLCGQFYGKLSLNKSEIWNGVHCIFMFTFYCNLNFKWLYMHLVSFVNRILTCVVIVLCHVEWIILWNCGDWTKKQWEKLSMDLISSMQLEVWGLSTLWRNTFQISLQEIFTVTMLIVSDGSVILSCQRYIY